jgi:hypothetical protein
MMISEFELWLRSRTSKEKRPFHEETILAYAKAARALDAWMTGEQIDGDFTACDTGVLNRFFRGYNAAHTRDSGHGLVLGRGEGCDVAAGGAVEAVVDAGGVKEGVEVGAGDCGAGVGGEARSAGQQREF